MLGRRLHLSYPLFLALAFASTPAQAGDAGATPPVASKDFPKGTGHSVPTGSNRRGIYLEITVKNAKGMEMLGEDREVTVRVVDASVMVVGHGDGECDLHVGALCR